MKKLLVLFLIISGISIFFSFIADNPEEADYITFEDALNKGFITAKVKSLGGHTGDCIEIEILSNMDYDTTLYLEPGRRFVSLDSTIQDILIVKDNEFILAANQKKKLTGYGFCCQASNGSPYSDTEFSGGRMADSSLVVLANYLNKNDYSTSAMQGAVWVLSDQKPLSAIWDGDKEKAKEIRELQKFVAKLAGISVNFAWYSIKYKQDTTMLFTGKHDTLSGEIDYHLSHNSVVNLVMYDSLGKVIHTFFKQRMQNPGDYMFPVEFSVSDWPKGQYYIRLFADGQMKQEKIFTL